jgi:hypothetical protein
MMWQSASALLDTAPETRAMRKRLQRIGNDRKYNAAGKCWLIHLGTAFLVIDNAGGLSPILCSTFWHGWVQTVRLHPPPRYEDALRKTWACVWCWYLHPDVCTFPSQNTEREDSSDDPSQEYDHEGYQQPPPEIWQG